MSRSITLGQYLPGNSYVHRLNPRLKILALLLLLVLLFSLNSFAGLFSLLAMALLLLFSARIPFRYFLKGLRPILYIVIFALIIYLFFTKGGVVLLRIGSFTIESEGVREGFFVITRLITLIIFSLLVTLTTTPLSLTHGMSFFMKPLSKIGLPTDEVAMIMAIALRFIPTLMEESQRLMRAQVSRGADFETGSIFRRAQNLVPLIVPLFVSAFRRADDLALAMEARGYRLGAKRTRLHVDKVLPADLGTLIFVIILIAAAFYFKL
ncbi:MAG: energy-coupling factor transporter transmembrane protein EcfT [Bacillota bacterium]|nr:energy-coupling factor transporter transmembrane protein EcfT [Bacillota bacterium]MDW7729459.1 energy-coupling factor transporter transmembrane protein EcfT [Bacillota bacterium]